MARGSQASPGGGRARGHTKYKRERVARNRSTAPGRRTCILPRRPCCLARRCSLPVCYACGVWSGWRVGLLHTERKQGWCRERANPKDALGCLPRRQCWPGTFIRRSSPGLPVRAWVNDFECKRAVVGKKQLSKDSIILNSSASPPTSEGITHDANDGNSNWQIRWVLSAFFFFFLHYYCYKSRTAHVRSF